MTPIEQKIKEAIIEGCRKWITGMTGNPTNVVLPLVMAVLKPLLDDARALAEIVRPNTKSRTVQDFCERIHAETEPGPGADSSPVCANCGIKREDHSNTGTCQHYVTALQMAMIQGQYLSEQSRQAAAGVPNNDAPIMLCPRCEGCGVYNFGPCSICNGTGRLGPDGEAFKPIPTIPTITGSADAMKTPGPAPLVPTLTSLAKTVAELVAKVAALEKGKVAT